MASGMSDMQKKKVEMLADKLLDLNLYEMRWFSLYLKERVQKTSGVNPMKINLDWPSVKEGCK